MHLTKPILLAAAVAALMLAACRPVTPQGAVAPVADGGADPLAGTAWVLTELNGQPPLAETTVTLEFMAPDRAGGSDGCNNYGTTYTVDGDAITFAPNGMSTMMACPDPIMTQAAAYQAALAGAVTFAVADDVLTLSDASGAAVAIFAAQSTELAGTSWDVINYNNGNQAVVGMIEGVNLTANFGADGTLSGFAGCNNYSGGYATDGANGIAIGPLAVTMMMCMEPEGIAEQEMQYLAALATAAVYRISGDQLELRTADDALAALFRRATPAATDANITVTSETVAASAATDAAVTGTVAYLVRSALPPDAVVTVSIHNKQLADAPPEMTLLGQQVIPTAGQQVPIPYAVGYNSADVKEGQMYSIGARIEDGAGKLLFVSTTMIPVITNGAPTADVAIIVDPVQ